MASRRSSHLTYSRKAAERRIGSALRTSRRKEPATILATVKVGDFDRFLETFTTKGAEKRKEHGSGGAEVFRDPNDDTRAWVVFDMDDATYQGLMSDPDMPPIFEEAGLEGRPQSAEHVRSTEV